MPGFVLALWRGDGVDHVSARVEFLRDSLDGAALAGGIPAFKEENHRALLYIDLVAQFAELNLARRHLADIGLAIQFAGQIECFQHQSLSPPSDSMAARSSASLANSAGTSTRGGASAPSRFSITETMVSKILLRAYHFEVASTMVHGANSDSVSSSISSVAARYSSYFLWRAQSAAVTRQASSGSASMARKRSFCSFLEMCRKNFTMPTPSSASVRSNSTMSR